MGRPFALQGFALFAVVAAILVRLFCWFDNGLGQINRLKGDTALLHLEFDTLLCAEHLGLEVERTALGDIVCLVEVNEFLIARKNETDKTLNWIEERGEYSTAGR